MLEWMLKQNLYQRLGYYFSYLWNYWFLYCPVLETSGFHAQVSLSRFFDGVCGSLKMVCQCQNLGLVRELEAQHRLGLHIESSVKFFLDVIDLLEGAGHAQIDAADDEQVARSKRMCNYVGPYLQENLGWRLEESARKTSIGQHVQAEITEMISSVDSVESVDHVESRLLLRGYIFQPWEKFAKHFNNRARRLLHASRDDHISPTSMKGWYTKDLPAIQPAIAAELNSTHWIILPKMFWLSPAAAVPHRDENLNQQVYRLSMNEEVHGSLDPANR